MLASFIIVFREVLEAGLIVGIVLAATVGIRGRGRYLAAGIAAGIAGACLLAGSIDLLATALAGNGQDIFTVAILVLAVLMLGWHTIWMSRHGREIARQMQTLGGAVKDGQRTLFAMAVVVAIAVLREGAEVVLFLYGIAISAKLGAAALIGGGLAGVAGGVAVAWLLYRGLLAIPLHRLFGVTSWLIALLAAGMAGQAAALLASDDLIPAFGNQVWNTSWLLSTASLPGKALQALIGYSDRPMGVQIAVYVATLAILILAARRTARAGG
ncbi:MAG: FTR1 family protein [Rhodospirillales bacterium]|nr:FTR1 family protein [Rhodospirillales bacterium]